MWYLSRIIGLAIIAAGIMRAPAALAPYTADVTTLHLWHLDDVATPALDSLARGTNLTTLSGGATLGNVSFAGFGSCLNTADGGQSAIATTGRDAALSGLPLANGTADDVNLALADSSSGAFTFEALVRIDFNPTNTFVARGSSMQILSGEGDLSADRIFQLRLVPLWVNASGVSDTNTVRLEFINLRQAAAVQSLVFTIPTNGPNAIASNQWYHVAVAYNGSENTADNLVAYWTALDPNTTAAYPIGTGLLVNDLSVAGCDFTIGNEGRATGGSTDNFIGLIDEVRISNVARGTNEFVFRSLLVEASSTEPATTNFAANTLDGNLNSRWSAQGDGQWITYDLGRIELITSVDIAFYLGNTRIATVDFLTSCDNSTWRTMLTNAVSSGTTLGLQSFDLTDVAARYVRIVGHGNSVNNFNSFTEVAINRSIPTDADADGLPDVWEQLYFSSLVQTVTGDPDGDALSNAYEFLHGTDPTQPSNVSDADNDGLPDAWEQLFFGNLGQSGATDYDRDGLSNVQEYANGTDPKNPNSIIGDSDGDSLPDAWELASIGNTSSWAYEDPDNDGYNNVAELVAGTSPTNSTSQPGWVAPRVSLLRDSVITNNACLMPNTAPYGRAINGIAFQTDILRTFAGYQYTAWYDTVGTVQTVWLARRTVTNTSVGPWELFNTGSTFVNGKGGWDAHNVIALGISPIDGTLHFAWDHHGHNLRYRRSVMGLCTTNRTAWGAGMLLPETNSLTAPASVIGNVTYPRFHNTPANGLVFSYRTGSTSAGDHWLHNYVPGTGLWSARWKIEAKEGTYTGVLKDGTYGSSTSRNAYENGYDFAPNGTLHHTWTFREAADAANHDLCYAYSSDAGVTWRNNSGALVVNTATNGALRIDTPGIIIKPLDGRQRLINQQAQCVDNDGRVHILALHRRVEPGYEWNSGEANNQFSTAKTAYYHYFRDPTTGAWSQRQIPPTAYPVGCRPALGFDAQGNLYAAFLSYPAGTDVVPGYRNGQLVIASASKASAYSDWTVVQALATDFNGEPRIDPSRLLADNILSVFVQENSATTGLIGTPLHVIDFAVGVGQPNPVSLEFRGNDSLVTVVTDTNHTYQLRTTPVLGPPTWTTNGPAIPGHGGLLSWPETDVRSQPQRYYNVLREP